MFATRARTYNDTSNGKHGSLDEEIQHANR